MLGDEHAHTHAHLRLPRLAAFTMTNSLCGACGGLSIWALVVAKQRQADVRHAIPGASLHINDIIASGASITVAAGISSILCFLMVGLIMFRRRAPETIRTVRIKEGLFGITLFIWIVTLIPYTVIIATRSGVVRRPGVSAAVIANIIALSGESLRYRDITAPLSAMIVGWCAFLSTCVTLFLLSLEARYVLKHGPDGGLLAPASAMPANHSIPQSEGSMDQKHNTMAEKSHNEHVV